MLLFVSSSANLSSAAISTHAPQVASREPRAGFAGRQLLREKSRCKSPFKKPVFSIAAATDFVMRLFGNHSSARKPLGAASKKSAVVPPASTPPVASTSGIKSAGVKAPDSSSLSRKEATRRPSRPLLDPHGIYGTRTASRLRAAQRRRTMQTLLLFAALVGLGLSLMTWARARRVLRVSSRWTQALMAVPSAPPAFVQPPIAASTNRKTLAAMRAPMRPTVLVPTEEGLLLSVDAASGAIKTSFSTAFPLRAQPLAVDETVFVGGSDGVFSAVRWREGRTLWTRRTGAAFSTRAAFTRLWLPAPQPALQPASSSSRVAPGIAGAPAAKPSEVVGSRASGSKAGGMKSRGVVFAGNDSGEIVALEAASGAVLWRYNAQAPIGAGITVTLEGSSASSIAASQARLMNGSAASSGSRMSTYGARVLVPLLAGLGSSGGVLCLDARSGRVLWRKDLGAACLPAPVVEEGATSRVYCCTDNGAVLCLDLASGRKLWKVFVSPLHEASGGRISSSSQPQTREATLATSGNNQTPVADDGSVIALRGEPLLFADGRQKFLVLGGNDGGVRCLRARDGFQLWNFDARFAVRCRPASLRLNSSGQAQINGASGADAANGNTSRNLILVGSDGPVIYALEARSGVLAWQFATRGPTFNTPFLHDQELIALTGQGYAQSFTLPQ